MALFIYKVQLYRASFFKEGRYVMIDNKPTERNLKKFIVISGEMLENYIYILTA